MQVGRQGMTVEGMLLQRGRLRIGQVMWLWRYFVIPYFEIATVHE